MVSKILLVVSLGCLAVALATAVGQVLKEGLKGLKFMPSGLFLLFYALTYALWLVL